MGIFHQHFWWRTMISWPWLPLNALLSPSDPKTLFSGSYNKYCGWLIAHMVTVLHLSFGIWLRSFSRQDMGLFSRSLNLGWLGDLLWPIEGSGEEGGPVLRPQEALRGFHSHRWKPAAPCESVWASLVGDERPRGRGSSCLTEPILDVQTTDLQTWESPTKLSRTAYPSLGRINKRSQDRMNCPTVLYVDSWKIINAYSFGSVKLGAFCYAAIANRYNPKKQDHWSEPLWLVHGQDGLGTLSTSCLPRSLHWVLVSTQGPPKVAKTLKSLDLRSSMGNLCPCRMGSFLETGTTLRWGRNLSVCLLPLVSHCGSSHWLGFKAGRVARSAQAPGSRWDEEAPGTFLQNLHSLPQEDCYWQLQDT